MDNRELGNMEKAMETLNRHGGGFLVVTVGRIKGPLNAEMVRRALDLVQCRHPRLNSRIVGSLDNLCFKTGEMPLIPLRVVDKLHNEQWTDIVLEELNEKIDSSKGLLRAVLVLPMNESRVNYLLLTVLHTISDGLSCLQLYSEILAYTHNVESLLGRPNEVLGTVSVSNVGRVNIPRVYGSLELEEISFVPSIAAYGGVFYAAITTFQGKIFWNFPFSEPAISLHTIENLVNSAVSYIVDACQGYYQQR